MKLTLSLHHRLCRNRGEQLHQRGPTRTRTSRCKALRLFRTCDAQLLWETVQLVFIFGRSDIIWVLSLLCSGKERVKKFPGDVCSVPGDRNHGAQAFWNKRRQVEHFFFTNWPEIGQHMLFFFNGICGYLEVWIGPQQCQQSSLWGHSFPLLLWSTGAQRGQESGQRSPSRWQRSSTHERLGCNLATRTSINLPPWTWPGESWEVLEPTTQSQQWWVFPAIVHAGGVRRARHPEVFVDGGGGDDTPVHGGGFPVPVGQAHTRHHPSQEAQQEPHDFQARIHDPRLRLTVEQE